MKMKKVMYAACLFTGIVLSSCDKSDDTDVSASDKTFTMQASLSNTVEVNAGNLAATKATNAQVKGFGQKMSMEHSMAQTDLKNVGSGVGVAVRDTVDPAHTAVMNMLMTMPAGRSWDSMYIYSQVMDHDVTIANFQSEMSNGSNSNIKNYANTYLPHIQMHRQSADSIATAFFKK